MAASNDRPNPYAAPATDLFGSAERPALRSRVEAVVNVLFVIAVTILVLIFGWVVVALGQWAFHWASPGSS
jgi:hypothetical protein